ncbi:hypothetical protein ACIP3B_24365 [Streptomyces anulatus]
MEEYLDEPPDAVPTTTRTLATNAVHLARRLSGSPWPGRLIHA